MATIIGIVKYSSQTKCIKKRQSQGVLVACGPLPFNGAFLLKLIRMTQYQWLIINASISMMNATI